MLRCLACCQVLQVLPQWGLGPSMRLAAPLLNSRASTQHAHVLDVVYLHGKCRQAAPAYLPDAWRTQQQAAADGELSLPCRLETAVNDAGGTTYQWLASPTAGLSFCRAHSPLSKKVPPLKGTAPWELLACACLPNKHSRVNLRTCNHYVQLFTASGGIPQDTYQAVSLT
mgnify:CR=1 FL=1